MDVVDRIVDETDAVVAALRHPDRDIAFGEPASPTDLQGLAEVVLACGRDDRPEGDEAEDNQLAGKAGPVARFECVEKPRVPLDHRHGDIDEAELGADHPGDQARRAPDALGAKVRKGNIEESARGDDNAAHDPSSVRTARIIVMTPAALPILPM